MEEEKKETQKKDSGGFGCLFAFLLSLIPYIYNYSRNSGDDIQRQPPRRRRCG